MSLSDPAARERVRMPWYDPRSVWRSIVMRPRIYVGTLVGLAVASACTSRSTC